MYVYANFFQFKTVYLFQNLSEVVHAHGIIAKKIFWSFILHVFLIPTPITVKLVMF